MSFPSEPVLLGRYWQAEETLYDILAETTNLQSGIVKGLDFILSTLGRSSGAIYIPSPADTSKTLWVKQKLSPLWEEQISNPESAFQPLIQQALKSGTVSLGVNEYDLAAVVPILSRIGSEGVLLINGTSGTPTDFLEWQLLTHPIGRAIESIRSKSALNNPEREVAVLKVIAEAQNTELDINGLQLHMVKSISDLFKADQTMLVLLDSDNRELAIRKELNKGSEWESEISLKLDQGLIKQCLQTGRPIEVDDPRANSLFNPTFDAPEGLQIHSILCVPVSANGQTLGVLVLYNIAIKPLNSHEIGLIMSMTIALANAMNSNRLFQQLKATNTDLEASRWELLHSRNTLRSLFDSIPASIYIVDRKYNLVAVNMSRAERAQNKPNFLVGNKCYEKFFQRSEPCAGCRVSETLMSWRSTSRINRQWVNKEQFLEWEITTFAVQDETNLPLQSIILEQDVTEKRHLEANLIQSEKLAAVGQLAAGVAHEINNPLAAIIANAQILQHDLPQDNADLQESVKLIEMAGARASQVVRNLLGFARKEEYEFSPADLNETIQNALSLLQHEFMSHPITLLLELDNDLPRIVASKDHLQGIWINMILNAFDAVDQEKGEIGITTRYQSNKFHVIISDNGKGIPQERLTHIFEPFYTTKAPGRGTGLGLSVCHRIVKQHGGYIQVESQVNKGTRFTIILPAIPV